jgi:hypothetical protein
MNVDKLDTSIAQQTLRDITVAKPASLTLEEFLKLPETKPACEYIDGEVIQILWILDVDAIRNL